MKQLMTLPAEPLKFSDLVPDVVYAVQRKLDGIRIAFDRGGIPITRSGKRIRNKELEKLMIEEYIDSPWFRLELDGEIIFVDDSGNEDSHLSYNEIQSIVMSNRKLTDSQRKNWRYIIFDYINVNETFRERWSYLESFYHDTPDSQITLIATNFAVRFAVEALVERFEASGWEGGVVRSMDRYYKHGRATYLDHIIFKAVTWLRDEAILVGVEEKLHNIDTSTTRKDNMIPAGTMGNLVVEHPTFKQFRIGSGFTDCERQYFWDNKDTLIKLKTKITFKYKPNHIKDVPAPAIFVGIKED